MASVDFARLSSAEERRRSERRHARLMFAVAYPVCLAIAVATRLVPRSRRRSNQGFDGHHSVFREARTAASMCIPFAFR